ncbi:MAG: hypothetical protein WCK29_00770 [archaeon]
MNILGFNFTKISAEKSVKLENVQIKTNISFEDPKKEDTKLLKDQEIVKFPFSYEIKYDSEDPKTKKVETKAVISFKGLILLSGTKEETKDLIKNWNSKESNSDQKVGIINTIIHKSTIKALALEEELDLPSHVNLPTIKLSK